MRRLLVGLMVVGLLAVAAPAMAQSPGSSDPLGLIISGAVLPYFGTGPSGAVQSFLEAYAPVDGNAALHMFFFDTTCTRQGDSVHLPLTENDVEFVRVDNFGNTPTTGLITMGQVDATGFVLEPIDVFTPVHLRVLWFDAARNNVRVLDPIAAQTFDNWWNFGFSLNSWHNLRTGAAFAAPLETTGVHTTLYLVCPNDNVIGTKATAALRTENRHDCLLQGNPPGCVENSANDKIFSDGRAFPDLIPAAQVAGTSTPLRVRVYDDDEKFLRDVTTTCDCLTVKPVVSISAVYADAALAPFGTFTEIEGGTRTAVDAVCSLTETVLLKNPPAKNAGNPCPLDPDGFTVPGDPTTAQTQFRLVTPASPGGGPFSFTGYRAITAGPLDIFDRLNNGAKNILNNSFVQDANNPFDR